MTTLQEREGGRGREGGYVCMQCVLTLTCTAYIISSVQYVANSSALLGDHNTSIR